MRRSSLALIGALFLFGCDIISTDISVSYPFDKDKAEEYEISIDDAMTMLNDAITAQTRTLVDLKVDTSSYPAGADIDVQTTLSLDDLLAFLGGKDATVAIEVTVTHASLPQQLHDTQNITFSICDFVTYKDQGVSTEFEFDDIHMTIMNLDTYCPGKTGENPYMFVTHRTVPKAIQLSENKELKDYKSLLNKIRSATLDDLRLTITEKPAGLSFDADAAPGAATQLTMSASLFVQPVKDCTGSADALTCTGVDFSEAQVPTDFYDSEKNRDPLTGVDPYWIGTFGTAAESDPSAMTGEGDVLKLNYTYDGNNILQKAIKSLDFQLGIKSWYKIRPGATRPTGIFKASVAATFFFSVEPLR